uniref:Uncharacterized protein n=1 Tax=Rhizophora mucronata TaxID=61149 RepID=A0A2P2Q9Y6_RHIMU
MCKMSFMRRLFFFLPKAKRRGWSITNLQFLLLFVLVLVWQL